MAHRYGYNIGRHSCSLQAVVALLPHGRHTTSFATIFNIPADHHIQTMERSDATKRWICKLCQQHGIYRITAIFLMFNDIPLSMRSGGSKQDCAANVASGFCNLLYKSGKGKAKSGKQVYYYNGMTECAFVVIFEYRTSRQIRLLFCH